MNDELRGYPSPIETNPENREFDSGPLVVGRITFERRPISVTDSGFFGGFPYYPVRNEDIKIHEKALDAEEIARAYETHVIQVDKRTHRIRFENETEHEVTVIIEPR